MKKGKDDENVNKQICLKITFKLKVKLLNYAYVFSVSAEVVLSLGPGSHQEATVVILPKK